MSLGLFLAVGVAARPGPRAARGGLAVLLVAAAAFAGEFAAMFSGLYRSPVVFLTYPLFFLLGPAAAFLLRALDGTLPGARRILPHLLPAVLAAIDLSPRYRALLGGGPFTGDGTLLGLGGYWQAILQLAHTSAYVAACLPPLRRLERRARDRHSGIAVDRVRWTRRIVGLFLGTLVIDVTAMLGMMLAHHHVLVAEAAMGLSVSGLVVGIGWMVLQRPGILDTSDESRGRYARSALGQEELGATTERITRVVEDGKHWLNPDLTLAALAEAVGLPRHQVSEALNRGMGLAFFDFVNAYRVREAARQLLLDEEPRRTMLAIAYDSGFASKASFNRVFKEQLGVTPTEFRARGDLESLRPILPLDPARTGS
jgi:AraC-like DNA-binding protein